MFSALLYEYRRPKLDLILKPWPDRNSLLIRASSSCDHQWNQFDALWGHRPNNSTQKCKWDSVKGQPPTPTHGNQPEDSTPTPSHLTQSVDSHPLLPIDITRRTAPLPPLQ